MFTTKTKWLSSPVFNLWTSAGSVGVQQQSSRQTIKRLGRKWYMHRPFDHLSHCPALRPPSPLKKQEGARENESERVRDRWVWDFKHAWPWAAMWQTPCPWPLSRLVHSKALRETESDRPWISTYLFAPPHFPSLSALKMVTLHLVWNTANVFQTFSGPVVP